MYIFVGISLIRYKIEIKQDKAIPSSLVDPSKFKTEKKILKWLIKLSINKKIHIKILNFHLFFYIFGLLENFWLLKYSRRSKVEIFSENFPSRKHTWIGLPNYFPPPILPPDFSWTLYILEKFHVTFIFFSFFKIFHQILPFLSKIYTNFPFLSVKKNIF